ncbi:MAG: HD domain-containing protein [Thermomicrobiales bacterium]
MSLSDAEAAGLARFLHRAGRLKVAARTGWLDRGIPPESAESVADHTFRTALLAWLAADAGLDRDRVLKLALIHDLAEAVTGDLPPYNPDLLPDEANDDARRTFLDQRHIRDEARTAFKRDAEAAAMADLTADLPPDLAAEINALWHELEDGTSPEARFVKQADKLETYLQSREYLADDPDRPMASFAAEVDEVIDAPNLIALQKAINSALPYLPDPSAATE